VIFDRLPGKFFQTVNRDTRIFALRSLGRNTSYPVAAFASALTSLGAGISEEVFFRGFCWSLIVGAFHNEYLALALSSALFGLAHKVRLTLP
jgi:membrane protease YdiL (CAAX protease family)